MQCNVMYACFEIAEACRKTKWFLPQSARKIFLYHSVLFLSYRPNMERLQKTIENANKD